MEKPKELILMNWPNYIHILLKNGKKNRYPVP